MKRLLAFFLASAILGAGCSTSPLRTESPVRTDEPPTKGSSVKEEAVGGPELDMSGRGLAAIPGDVFSRTELTRLDLSDNRLTGAPQAEIRQLQKLKFLDLSGNDLTGLPAELGQLKNLEILDVSNNRLTGLPLELGNLTQLRVLDLTGNPYAAQDLDQIAAKLTKTEIRR